jgi:hypothetical protein
MITRKFLSALEFRVMDKHELMGFAGVQSPVPLIAETDDYLVIIDGDRCEVYGEDSDLDQNSSVKPSRNYPTKCGVIQKVLAVNSPLL